MRTFLQLEQILELNQKELKKVAASIEVDEIHIFDAAGRIFAGTHPEYYNLTFDSGEHIMQYAALWSSRLPMRKSLRNI